MTRRHKRPDRKNAQSIIEAAQRDMEFTLSLDVNEQSGPTIVRNIYECFRMLGDALLVAKGIVSTDHVKPIKELLTIKAKTKRPISLISVLRQMRHNINYYGYKPNLKEIEDVISIAESCFIPVVTEIKKKIQ